MMSEKRKADATQTIIYNEDTPTLAPPRTEVGALAWLRQNLFGSPADIVISIGAFLLLIALVVSFFDWAIRSANWFAIINNQRLFMLERYEQVYEWRVALTVIIAAILTGVSFSVWARRSMRTTTMVALVILAVIVLAPPVLRSTLNQPPSYFTAGNVEIVDRASTLTPQTSLGFIAQAGETVTVQMANEATETIDTLKDLSGFSDRSTNALANSAQNRLEQQELNSNIFDSMVSQELTEDLEERTRIGIETSIRTTDMVASTLQLATTIRDRAAEGELTVSQLKVWLTRLNRSLNALEESDESVQSAVDAVNLSLDGVTAADELGSDVQSSLDALTLALMESPNLEDIGEILVIGITEDLIGEEEQPDDEEVLLTPTSDEAEFLHDMFVILLTPQSVIETYDLNQTPMQIQILEGQTLSVLAEGVVSSEGEVISTEIPSDGWYVLIKTPVDGENGTAILAVEGVFPIIERVLGANESEFVRLTDDELIVTASRPQIDGEDIPFAVLIDNQFRGLRDLQTYLIHFIPLFFEQIASLYVPLLLAIAWGYVIGRAIAHLLGEETHFSNTPSQLLVVGVSLLPLGIMLLYFAFIAGDFGIQPIEGFTGAILQIVLATAGVFLAGQIDSWLNRMNHGDDAETNITTKLIYSWGIFPVLMFVLASGIAGFSGAALGSTIGGLVWLVVMYFVGINFKGLLGYGLFIGALFLQFVQAFIVEQAWSAGTWHEGDILHIVIWLGLAIAGVAVAYVGHQLRQNRNIMFLRVGLVVGLILWLGALILTPITINDIRTHETTNAIATLIVEDIKLPTDIVSDLQIDSPEDVLNNISAILAEDNVNNNLRSVLQDIQAQDTQTQTLIATLLVEDVKLPTEIVNDLRIQSPSGLFDNTSLILAEDSTNDDVRAFLQDVQAQEIQAKTLNRGVAIVGWFILMFVLGQANLTNNIVFVGIALMTFHWYLWIVQIDIWSTIYFIAWLTIGMMMFNRGAEAGRINRKVVGNGEGSFMQRFALPGLIGSVIVWLGVLYLIPQAILALDSAGILQTSPQELLPLSDKRAWGGLMLTMQLTILGIGASFPIGLALALGRRSNLPVVKTACIIYIETVRGVPLITVLFLATLLVPLVEPSLATIEGAVRVWVGVTMFSAAYLAENVRGGLQSIPRGQTEAAQAIGLSSWQTTINILLPQALRAVIPALVGQFISLFKDTSLVVIVGLAEITGIANRVVTQPEFLQRRQETYLYIAIIYFVFSYIMSYISRRVEETGSGAARAQQI